MNTIAKSEGNATCPVCSVEISAADEVIFSGGRPGTRARLHARVCQYAKRQGCINRDPELIGEVMDRDGFQSGEELQFPNFVG
ncbi:MAG: hypothetical protein AAFY11_07200 [Cyanobacteria bacterium J06641_5]